MPHPDVLCTYIAEAIGRPHGYRFNHKETTIISSPVRGWPRVLKNCIYKIYQCSQQTNKDGMPFYACGGEIHFILSPTKKERKFLDPDCPLHDFNIIVEYRHPEDHEGRPHQPIPEVIKNWISGRSYRQAKDYLAALQNAAREGAFPGVNISIITPLNVYYWWKDTSQERMEAVLREREEMTTEMEREVRERALKATVDRWYDGQDVEVNQDEDEFGVEAADWIDYGMLLPEDEDESLDRFSLP